MQSLTCMQLEKRMVEVESSLFCFDLGRQMMSMLKLGTHHAIFVGTTIVVRRDDGRRSSNDSLTPRDGRRLNAHTTRRPTTVEADNAPGRNSTFR